MTIHPSLTQYQAWAEQVGIHFLSAPALGRNPWHWGLRMTRLTAEDRTQYEELQA